MAVMYWKVVTEQHLRERRYDHIMAPRDMRMH